MLRIKALLEERGLRLAFRISLWLKGAFAVAEIIGGVAAYFITHETLVKSVAALTRGVLTEDSADPVGSYLLQSAQQFSISTQHFTAIYLLSHGAIKLWLIVGLLRWKLWYYPAALVIFWLFVLYQGYRFSITFSPWLLLITATDLIVIMLTWHEFRYLRRALPNAAMSS